METIMKIVIVFSLFMLSSPMAFAQDESGEDLAIFGFEVEKLFNLGSGVLATVLAVLTYLAYKRTQGERLMYVTIAFILFAIKGFLTSLELLDIEISWVDPTASFLNFAILLCFFIGIVKK
jgi:hydrogenase/urease accessory protein HupE